MKLLTWNINSIRMRIDHLMRVVEETDADVVCLQETKAPVDKVPLSPVNDAGYVHHVLAGHKGNNGVAIFSRHGIEEAATHHWCDREDARHVSARLPGGIAVHNLYVPAGGDVPDPEQNDKFRHKLDFLESVTGWFAGTDGPQILVGDLNIAPLENDVWSHRQLLDVVSHTPVEVAALERFRQARGYVDTARLFVPPEEKLYSWWSYRAKDWRASDRGRRLDHIWVTPDLKERVRAVETLVHVRDWEKTSDHVPVLIDLAD